MWETSFGQLSGVAQPCHLLPQTLRTLGEAETKSGHQRELAALELLNTLFRNFHNEVSPGPSGRSPGGQSIGWGAGGTSGEGSGCQGGETGLCLFEAGYCHNLCLARVG